jgi:hypothetical protein
MIRWNRYSATVLLPRGGGWAELGETQTCASGPRELHSIMPSDTH